MPLFHTNFYAKSLHTLTNLMVTIPAAPRWETSGLSFDEIYRTDKKYPVLYLLHGMHEDETSWLRRSNIERYAEEKQVALVIPSVQNSFYTDTKSGLQYFTYLTEELPRFIRSVFPISARREDTFIAGLSMGGYGACKAALSKPEQYAAFASLSGAVDIGAVADHISSSDEEAMFRSVFGEPTRVKGSPSDLFVLAKKLVESGRTPPRAYFSCATEDMLCYGMNQTFIRHLDEIGLPYTYRETPGGHDWNFWDPQSRLVLDWLLEE